MQADGFTATDRARQALAREDSCPPAARSRGRALRSAGRPRRSTSGHDRLTGRVSGRRAVDLPPASTRHRSGGAFIECCSRRNRVGAGGLARPSSSTREWETRSLKRRGRPSASSSSTGSGRSRGPTSTGSAGYTLRSVCARIKVRPRPEYSTLSLAPGLRRPG
jgi:hypothetical protein